MTSRTRRYGMGLWGVWWLIVVGVCPLWAQDRSPQLFPVPDALKPNIAFWTRMFTELDTRSGVLHDARDVRVIYHTFRSLPEHGPDRAQWVQQYREQVQQGLTSLAEHQGQPQTDDEKRLAALFPSPLTPEQYRVAAEQVRFQRGLRDRFLAGLARSGAYMPMIEQIFKDAGLPRILTLLPHIESSFNNRAYSRAGAAGMWQFTRGTGRQFLTISEVIDERFDVRRASLAAAQLLQRNYLKLGTWPLAITAYNHGANGMKRAVQQLGTTDFGVIAETYRGPAFGFASRNFYAELLAVEAILAKPEPAFRELLYEALPAYHTLKLSAYVTLATLETYLGVDRRDLFRWNPFLRRILGPTHLRIPKGTTLYIETDQMSQKTLQARWAAIPSRLKFRTQLLPRTVRVRRGETLSRVSRRVGFTLAEIATANQLRRPYRIRAGQWLRLPYQLATRSYYRVQRGETLSTIAERVVMTKAALAKLNRLKPPYQLQVGQKLNVVTYNPQVRQYRVHRGETLSMIAKRIGVDLGELARLNRLKRPYTIRSGQLVRLPRSGQPPRRYRVRQGDTVSWIAERAGTTVAIIAMLNRLKQPYRILPGQLLKLPPRSTQTI